MDILKLIKTRRSIRRYKKLTVNKRVIKRIIQAGIWAPSGLNNQPWKFKVITNPELEVLSKYTKCSQIIKQAVFAICVFLDKKRSYSRDKDLMSVGACIQNMLLFSWQMGLGSCWLGEILRKKQAINKYLKIDSDFELMAVISFGYPFKKSKSSRRNIKSFMFE